ncbi:MAG: choice-of-anchor Q domain-containing protein [Saprospiraceae bacterium]
MKKITATIYLFLIGISIPFLLGHVGETLKHSARDKTELPDYAEYFLNDCTTTELVTGLDSPGGVWNDGIGNLYLKMTRSGNFPSTVAPLTEPNALHFSGGNDFVDVPSYQGIQGAADRTIEFLIKTTDGALNPAIFSWGTNSTGAKWTGRIFSGQMRVEVSGGAIIGSTAINDGQYHHVAVVFENDGTPNIEDIEIYIDGVLESISQVNPQTVNTGNSADVYIGGSSFDGTRIVAEIDEFRIWDVARTGTEIENNKDCELTGSETGLVAYYDFNQGIGGGDNTGLTTLIDRTSNGYNGTLNNFAPSGTISNFVTHILTPEPSVTIVSDDIDNTIVPETSVTFTATPTDGGSSPTYQWKKNGANVGTNSANYTDAALADGDVIMVEMTSSGNCPSTVNSNSITMTVVAPPTEPNALHFFGINDVVDVPSYQGIQGAADRTIEFLIKTTAGAQNSAIFSWGSSSIGAKWTGRVFTNKMRVEVNGGAIIGSTTINDGEYHHIAVVFENDGTPNIEDTKIYVDGVLESLSQVNPQTVNTGNSADVYIGGSSFDGTRIIAEIDEFRIWDVARTGTEIENNKDCEITGTESGLVVYYDFNQGTAGGDNTAITTLIDRTSNGYDGSLNNFSLNGNNSNWVENTLSAQAAVTITSDDADNTIAPGTSVTFTANPMSGGNSPTYQWKKNGTNVGSNSANYTDATLADGDVITVEMTSSLACVTNPMVGSNAITITVLSPPPHTEVYVNKTASGANNGSSWADAYTDLQDAIDLGAFFGLDIWVAAGTYLPLDAPDGTTSTGATDRNNAFHLDTDIKIYGGFAGTETMLSQRNPVTNVTILSGDFNGDDVDSDDIGSGTTFSISNNDENAYHIMITANLTNAAVIDGFTFSGGNAQTSLNQLIYDERTFISDNGAAQYNISSSPTMTNCIFTKNESNDGPGQYNLSSSPIMTNCTFTLNDGDYGGGQWNGFASSPIMTNCIFTRNFTWDEGGAQLNTESSSPAMSNCTFISNVSDSYGGAQANDSNSSPIMTNCTYTNNMSNRGGAMSNYSSFPILTNCIIWGNTAATDGYNIFNFNGTPAFAGCLIEESGGSSSWVSSFGTDNGNNIDGTPFFVDAANGDVSLLACSDAIDAGTATGAPATDIIGATRPQGAGYDIGAFEATSSAPICPNYSEVFVDKTASGANNGTSWADAFTDLQDAIDFSALFGSDIWVAAGTYLPHDAPDGTVSTGIFDSNNAFHLDTDMKIYGGFAGTETMLSQRDPATNVTILSGDYDGDDVVTGTGNTLTLTNIEDNAYHVMITADLTSAAVIDGFTFSGGNAGGSSFINYSGYIFRKFYGGGQLNYASELTVTNCIFTANYAVEGAGQYNDENANATITDCSFSLNFAGEYGGGQYNSEAAPTITNCTFTSNGGGYGGGAQYNDFASVSMTNCTFTSNFSFIAGQGYGGAQYSWGGPLSMTDCTFTSNSADYGGAQFNGNSNSMTFTNCTFTENEATVFGGVQNNYACIPTVTNCTFTMNSASRGGVQFNEFTALPAMTNCILWGNTASDTDPNIYNESSGNPTFTNCLIEGSGGSSSWVSSLGTDGGNNLDADPFFVDAANGDVSLLACSDAIDAGTATGAPATDIIGTTRPQGAGYDMGAYEATSAAPACPVANTEIYVKHNASGASNGTSWADAYTDLQDAMDDAAVSGLDIWVAAGTYLPLDAPDGTTSTGLTDRKNTFHLDTDTKIYGGFAGTETMLSQRDPMTNVTILSGDFDGDDIVTGGGSTLSITNNEENAYHVMVTANLTNATVIDGFTFSGGNANTNFLPIMYGGQAFDGTSGGGQYNRNSSPIMTNCTFTSNYSGDIGGGMYNVSSSVVLTNCIFTLNWGSWRGGGLFASTLPTTITNCTFTLNLATSDGGGLFFDSSSSTMTNCILSGNTASGNGPNIYNDGGTNIPTFTNCLIEGSGGSSSWLSSLGTDGGNNLDTDPFFVDAANGDLSLLACSDAIDAGTATGAPATDIIGTTRPQGAGYDMGAYEAVTPASCLCTASSPLVTAAGLYTSDESSTDANGWTNYCAGGKLLLSLKEGGTGVVIPSNGVSLNVSTPTAEYIASGGFITNPDGVVIFNRTWDVVPTTQPTSDVPVRHYFTALEYAAVNTELAAQAFSPLTNETQMWFYKATSGAAHASIPNIPTAEVLTNGIASSTNWALGTHDADHYAEYHVASFSGSGGGGANAGSSALSVESIYFNVAKENNIVVLDWQTDSKIDNKGFHIQRSINTIDFETIAWVDGADTIDGKQTYRSVDNTPHIGINYYRLVQEDFDGKVAYSPVRSIRFEPEDDNSILIFPNPVSNGKLIISLESYNTEKVYIQVFDILGRTMLQQASFTHRTDLSVGNLAAGVYLVVVKANGQIARKQVVIK